MTDVAEVVVVGAGPTGLLLAGELRRAGLSVIVVDRLAAPMTESRASQLNARSAELVHERGLDSLLTAHEPRGHFAGIGVDVSTVAGPFAGNWKVPQFRTEAALATWALGLGAELRRDHELTALDQDGDRVACTFANGERLSAGFVAGCDGQDSAVRRLAGFEYRFVAPSRELLRADVTGLDIPDRRFERFEHGLAVAATREAVTRVMVHETGRTVTGARPTFADVAEVWAKVTGEDISAGEPVWVDSFDNARGHVTRYRRGRVFLAGDAAHRCMPIGGQALNVALADAVSLGRAIASGDLDGYHDERHPAAAKIMRLVVAQEELLLGGSDVEPVRAVLAELLALPAAQAHLAGLLSGIPGNEEP